jgi:hypothetical protein
MLQYATLLVLVLAGEMSLLAVGYRLRGHMDTAFHSGLSAGLQQYGKSPERTAAIDEIQSTVRPLICTCAREISYRNVTKHVRCALCLNVSSELTCTFPVSPERRTVPLANSG